MENKNLLETKKLKEKQYKALKKELELFPDRKDELSGRIEQLEKELNTFGPDILHVEPSKKERHNLSASKIASDCLRKLRFNLEKAMTAAEEADDMTIDPIERMKMIRKIYEEFKVDSRGEVSYLTQRINAYSEYRVKDDSKQ